MKHPLPLILAAVTLCWIIDGTTCALDIEVALSERMAIALQTILRGLAMPETLAADIAPACSGLRTAVACAIFGAFHSRRRIIATLLGAIAGLWLNLLRLLAIELALRIDPALGHTLHDFALPLLIAPSALILLAYLARMTTPARLTLATAAPLLLVVIMAAHTHVPAARKTVSSATAGILADGCWPELTGGAQ